MLRFLAITSVILLLVGCTSESPSTTEPTATAEPTPTLVPTSTPVPPTNTPEPSATPVPSPTPTPEPTATPVPSPTVTKHESAIRDLFPDIGAEMESVEPTWTVYYHSDDWLTPGYNTSVDGVFRLLKLENIVNHEGYQQVDPEMIVDREPDIIVAESIEAILENPHLSGLHMVQDPEHVPHHIFVLGDEYSFDPGSHHFEGAIQLFAAFVYPEVFGNYKQEGTDQDEEEQEGEEEHGHDHEDGHSH